MLSRSCSWLDRENRGSDHFSQKECLRKSNDKISAVYKSENKNCSEIVILQLMK